MCSSSETDHSSFSAHIPVLLNEVLALLAIKPGQTIVDATVGGGGHGREIIKKVGPQGRLLAIDRDPMMLNLAKTVLTEPNCIFHQGSYAELPSVIERLGIDSVDGILVDLGFSSDQLADDSRGFRFDSSGPLDLRFDPTHSEPAWRYLQQVDEETLASDLRTYGEERFSDEIASAIVRHRQAGDAITAEMLVELVLKGVPRQFQREAKKHSATRVFQALRIVVNRELEQLEESLVDRFPAALKRGGRLVVISFHSLEDRLVKNAFRNREAWQCLTPKPITANPRETRMNPRSRSAKLRGAVRL